MTVAEHNEYERKVAENRRKKDQIQVYKTPIEKEKEKIAKNIVSIPSWSHKDKKLKGII